MNGGHPAATILFSLVAVILFAVNAALTFFEKSDAAIAAGYVTGVFCLIFAFLARFRRFKGLGIEAELWEQKQEEAAKLIESLKSLAVLVARHVVALSTISGRLEAPSKRDVFDFVRQVEGLARDIGASTEDINVLKAPHYYYTSIDLASPISRRFKELLDEKTRKYRNISMLSPLQSEQEHLRKKITRKKLSCNVCCKMSGHIRTSSGTSTLWEKSITRKA